MNSAVIFSEFFHSLRGFPFVKQRDSMQCGVACLVMVCRHYGASVGISRLEALCRPTVEGVSMKAIADAAGEAGIATCGIKVVTDRLQEMPLPMILHWNQNHFVVLYRISRGGKRFHIADPGKGKMTLTREEFERHWAPAAEGGEAKGLALVLQPDEEFEEFRKSCIKEKISFAVLTGYLKKYKSYFLQIAIGLGLACVFQLIMPFLMQAIIDRGIKNADIAFIWLVLLGELMIVLGSTVTDFIRRWLLLHISMRINVSMVSDFFIKLMKLPMAYFDTKLLGDLLQRMGDHSRVQSFLTNQTLNLVFSAVSLLVFSAVLLIYSPMIFAVYIAGSLCYVVWTLLFLRKRKVLDYATFEQQAINSNKTYQLITSMQEIKLQSCEKRRRWEWEDVQADLFGLQMKSLRLQQSQEAGSIFINEIKNILVTVFAATAVIGGELTLGGMLAIQYIIGQLNSPVSQMIGFIYGIQDVAISLERINDVRAQPDEDESRRGLPAASRSALRPLCFHNVDFRYDPHSSKVTVAGIDLTIDPGKVTALVGASGSGKTTLIKLLLGYYPPEKGSICVGDDSLAEINLADWRRHCGVVMQDGVIFSESIERNIAANDADVDTARLHEAARIACIDEFIGTLPLGYATKIGQDGVGLSQGQKQRILIARAVYRNPDYIFLDEATNALDAVNERRIVENLREFYKGKTVVIVAHRLSTVCDADNIVVLDGGCIAETGNHATLTRKKGLYYNLIKNQLELGQ